MDDDAMQQRSPQSHPATLPAARRAIAGFVPSGNAVELRALFHNRVALSTIRQWMLGRRSMPRWAVELLRERAAPSFEVAWGPGSIVGKYNLPSIKEKARQRGELNSLPLIEKR